MKNEADGGQPQQQQDGQQLVAQQQQQQAGAGYLCPRCLQQAGDTSPLDLLQLHAALLADMKPRRPRSAADIHAAEVTQKVCMRVWCDLLPGPPRELVLVLCALPPPRHS